MWECMKHYYKNREQRYVDIVCLISFFFSNSDSAFHTLLQDHYLAISLHEAVSAKMNALPNELGDEYIEFINTIEGNTLQQLERMLARKI